MTDTATKTAQRLESDRAAKMASALRAGSLAGMRSRITLDPPAAEAMADLLDNWTDILVTRAVTRIIAERAKDKMARTFRWHLWGCVLCQSVVIWNTLLEVAR